MKRIISFAAASLLAASLGAPGDLMAQTKDRAAPAPKVEEKAKAEPAALLIEGRVKSVDATGRHLTLEDGTKLMIPKSVKAPKEGLKPGVTVMAQYQEKGGQKVVTSIEVRSTPQS